MYFCFDLPGSNIAYNSSLTILVWPVGDDLQMYLNKLAENICFCFKADNNVINITVLQN